MKKYWHKTKDRPVELTSVLLITKDLKIIEGSFCGGNKYWIPSMSIYCPASNFLCWCYRKEFLKEFELADFIEKNKIFPYYDIN